MNIRLSHACVAALLAVIAGCSQQHGAFETTIQFGQQTLHKATAWTREGKSGIVYVPPGETLPLASLQVGVIVSTEHKTAKELMYWVSSQFYSSGVLVAHDSESANYDACRVVLKPERSFVTLLVCKTGVARAACVEADEAVDADRVTSCMGRIGCFEPLCDERWRLRREPLDLLAADVLSRR